MESKELIQELRSDAEWAHANEWETPIMLGDHLDAAADAIEALVSVTAERDAAVEDIEEMKESLPGGVACYFCKHYTPSGGDGKCGADIKCNFEWRGAGKEQNDG